MLLRRNRHDEADDGGQDATLRLLVEDVTDPALFERLGDLETVRSVRRSGGGVRVELAVAPAGHPAPGELRASIEAALAAAGEPSRVELVSVELGDDELARLSERLRALDAGQSGSAAPGAGQPASPPPAASGAGTDKVNPIAGTGSRTRVIAVASGKGGVGKSSVTVNLAVALARAGHTVGLLDADIYGFSVPRMLGVSRPPATVGKLIVPPVAHGVRVVSMAFFVDEEQAVAWRGPMLHRALEQFLNDVHWGRPEYLVVDMPPGTGDVPLSVAQQLPRAELVVVTTPQPAAQRVAQRAAALARQLRLPVRGVVENMSYFEAPDGTRHEIFGSGGGEVLAASLGVPLLAQVPLVPAVREGADDGRPAALVDPAGPVAQCFEKLAAALVAMGPARVYRSELNIRQASR